MGKHKVKLNKSFNEGSPSLYYPMRIQVSTKFIRVQIKALQAYNKPYGIKIKVPVDILSGWDEDHLIKLGKWQEKRKTLKSMGDSDRRYCACQGRFMGNTLHIQIKCNPTINKSYGCALDISLCGHPTYEDLDDLLHEAGATTS